MALVPAVPVVGMLVAAVRHVRRIHEMQCVLIQQRRNDVRRLRLERGWSQVRLGEGLGVSRQTINALESGRYDPSLPLAFRVAALFDLPIEGIFFPEDGDAPPSGGRHDDGQ